MESTDAQQGTSLQLLSHGATQFRGNAWNYPFGWKPVPATERLDQLQHIWGMDDSFARQAIAELEAVDNRGSWSGDEVWTHNLSDGIFVAPKLVSAMDKLIKSDPYGNDYGMFTSLTLGLIEPTVLVRLSNRHQPNGLGGFEPESLRLNSVARDMVRRLEEDTPGDYIVRRFNSGSAINLCGQGQAIERMQQSGFTPFTLYHIAILLLTMPERLTDPKHLWLMSAADDYNSSGLNEEWDGSVLARFSEKSQAVVITDVWKGDLREYYGFPFFL